MWRRSVGARVEPEATPSDVTTPPEYPSSHPRSDRRSVTSESSMSTRHTINQRLAGVRDRIDSRDGRRFGLGLTVFLTVVLTLVISSNYLPSRHNFQVGDVAEESVVATRTVIFDCLLYTSDAADDLLCVDLGGR